LKDKKSVLTGQELEIMKIVWQFGTATVRDVYEELLKVRKIAYTTVMTMMGILEQKGRLTKTQRDRAYVYSPTESQGEVVGSMVHEFVKRVFDGSAKPLLVHLAENKKISQKELDEIGELLKKRRRKS
jgi:predicted transcriptional regulator